MHWEAMERPWYRHRISELFEVHPTVAILGPRQCGKTTLARAYAQGYDAGPVTTFDLEDPTDAALLDNPKLALQDLAGLVIIDEVQRAPGLFEVLRALVDREGNPCRFLETTSGVSFEEVVFHIANGDVLDVIRHHNKDRYPNQKIIVLNIEGYVFLVPYVKDKGTRFLKTIIPSRKATKEYLLLRALTR